MAAVGGARIRPVQKESFWSCVREGATIEEASRIAGFSRASGERLVSGRGSGGEWRAAREERLVPETPLRPVEWSDAAREALADRSGFLFCKRYAGWELSPFQQTVWRTCEDLWEEPERSFGCLNGPPGGGKSTSLVGFAAKQTVLNRAIRGMFMSGAKSLAEKNTRRTRMLLSRASPMVGAVSTLAKDFGRFKPLQGGDVWRADEFTVLQMDGELTEEKEATWTAFGFDSIWVGNRINLLFGDDLDTTKSIRNLDIVEANWEVFDNELEPRLEPGGLLLLAQQRLGAFDFSAHVTSKVILPDDDDGEAEDPDGSFQYTHMRHKVHYEEVCRDLPVEERRLLHRPDAPAYPEGCLLDPRRLSYRDVRKAMRNPQTFKMVYQQEDPGDDDALVQRLWIDGGRDADGNVYIGCWDKDRGAWELPRRADGTVALDGKVFGVLTADPSPTEYWACHAYVYHPASEQRFLLDVHNEKMEAPDFLEWDVYKQAWTGLAEDWWHLYQRLGVPLTHLIFEKNVANRFVTQYDHFHRWRRARKVEYLEHDTNRNKADENYGVQMIASTYKFGQIRLPGKQNNPGRMGAIKLVDEVLRYPHARRTDNVMAQWFLEHNIPKLTKKNRDRTRQPADPRRPPWTRAA